MLAQSRKSLLLLYLQRLDELDLFTKQQDHQTHDLLIHSLLNRNATVSLQADSRNILEGLNGGRVNEVEETHEVYPLLVPIQSEQYLHLVFRLANAVFLQHLQDVPAGDESLSPRDIVEEREGMEVWSGGNGLAVGLQDVLLLLQQGEVGADVVEDLSLFQLGTLAHTLPVHNEYIIIFSTANIYAHHHHQCR